MHDPSDYESPEHDNPPAVAPEIPKIRLQRFLAACGLGSRRACEEYITQGRVTVDGVEVTELGVTVNPSVQKIMLDGERLRMERKKYYLFNKPTGVLCTNNDPKRRPRVVDFFPDAGPRLFTVGRLDEDSEGLILVTNDGDLAQRMAHPRYRIYRTYLVQVAGFPTREIFDQLKKGVFFLEGKFKVHDVQTVKRQGQSMWLEVILSEGHNREIRRLFAKMGHKVMRLERIAFGPLSLGKLKAGEFRELRHEELERLHSVLMKAEAQSRPSSKTRKPARPGRPARANAPIKDAPRPLRPRRAPAAQMDEGEPDFDLPLNRHPALPYGGRPADSPSDSPPPGGPRSGRPGGARPGAARSGSARPRLDRAGAGDRETRPPRKGRPRAESVGDAPPAEARTPGHRAPRPKGAPAKGRPARFSEGGEKRPAFGEKRFTKRTPKGEAKRRPQRRTKPRRGEGRG